MAQRSSSNRHLLKLRRSSYSIQTLDHHDSIVAVFSIFFKVSLFSFVFMLQGLSCYEADTEEDEALRLLRWQIAFVSGSKCNTVQSGRPSGM
ncbi:hypothetical protein QYF36_019260 [Acer negundo]|nr:hypothetical protein QYF36_019260 [Acer negundo]